MTLFGSRIPRKVLAMVCRSLATLLDSGVSVIDAFQLTADKLGHRQARQALLEVVTELKSGNDIAGALELQRDLFPDLFIDMIRVAEHTGKLPEILRNLGDHYENLVRLRREFLGQITWPMIQLIAAILVIGALIWILGLIADFRGTEPLDVLGWGLLGAEGAILWYTTTFGALLGGWLLYRVVSGSLAGKRFLDPILMHIPVVGQCMRSFAIARFSWAYYLTQEAGMPIADSLDASFRATANGAFLAAAPMVRQLVMSGSDLSSALAAVDLFPQDFLHMVHVAETSGTVPEMLHRMSPQFEDAARRSLNALAAAIAWLVWLAVAGFIIFIVFTIFMWYLNQLSQFLP